MSGPQLSRLTSLAVYCTVQSTHAVCALCVPSARHLHVVCTNLREIYTIHVTRICRHVYYEVDNRRFCAMCIATRHEGGAAPAGAVCVT